ncbi:MAG: sigma-54-dependent Fis family transcriptional regulator [Bacteriovoracaceae bacterium]|jgi:two-component system, response regulator FlrC|nr:sigma-54-dependent Fis family transcriptional regulator [Bacteriovoracaceae bacterium]
MQNVVNEGLFGRDLKVQRSLDYARNVASTRAPVLIIGESGTGKRTLATYVHQISSRKENPLSVIDCSGDSKDVENQILGHRDDETGRFNKGVLETCNRGTIILANVDGLEEVFQKRLYQIFQELDDYDLDVRIIATSTKNLSKLVGSGRFYRALYTLISGTQISLKPLRERVEDIKLLSEGFLRDWGIESDITDEAMNKLTSHYWTHNIRELQKVLESSVQNAGDTPIDIEHLTIGERKVINSIDDDSDGDIKLMSLKEAEKLLIRKALIHTSENRTQAAKILGVSIRTLRNKINEYRQDGSQFFLNLR